MAWYIKYCDIFIPVAAVFGLIFMIWAIPGLAYNYAFLQDIR